MMNVNKDQVTGMLRIIIPVLLTFLASQKLIPADAVGQWTDAIVNFLVSAVILVSLILSYRAWNTVQQIDTVSKMPEVKAVVAETEISKGDLNDNPKVVAPGEAIP